MNNINSEIGPGREVRGAVAGMVTSERPVSPEAEPPPPAHHPPITGRVRRALMGPAIRWWAGAAITLLAGLLLLFAPTPLPKVYSWPGDADRLWTPAERERVKREGLLTGSPLSLGPPPFATAPARGPGSVPLRASGARGTVRVAFDRGLAALAGPLQDQWRVNAGQVPLDRNSTRAAENNLGGALNQMGPIGKPPETFAVNYHLALLRLWRGDPQAAQEAISAARLAEHDACPDKLGKGELETLLDASGQVRGATIVCYWLKGRIALARQTPDEALAPLQMALRLSGTVMGDYADNPQFSGDLAAIPGLNPRLHLVEASVADIWRDYFVAILKSRSPPGYDAEGVPGLKDLLVRQGALSENPSLAALAKAVAVRQERPGVAMAVALPSGVESDLLQLAAIADLVAGRPVEPPLTNDPQLGQKLQAWKAHNCHREAIQEGLDVECPGADRDFENRFEGEYKAAMANMGLGAAALKYARLALAGVLVLIGLTLLTVGLRVYRFRRQRYVAVFGSSHLVEALDPRRRRHEPRASAP